MSRDVFHTITLEELVKKSNLILVVKKSYPNENSKETKLATPVYFIEEILMNTRNRKISPLEYIKISPAYAALKLKDKKEYKKSGIRKTRSLAMYQPLSKANDIFNEEKLIVFLINPNSNKCEFTVKNAFDLITNKEKVIAEINARK